MLTYYTGVGSRETPEFEMSVMTQIANKLRVVGCVLRSGGAAGADIAFEHGAGQLKEIYVPWNGFRADKSDPWYGHGDNGRTVLLSLPNEVQEYCFNTAASVHPVWDRCSTAARRLHARNVLQVRGVSGLKSDFVIYWSKYDKNENAVGGTRTAVELAKQYDIPTFNLNVTKQREALKELLSTRFDINHIEGL